MMGAGGAETSRLFSGASLEPARRHIATVPACQRSDGRDKREFLRVGARPAAHEHRTTPGTRGTPHAYVTLECPSPGSRALTFRGTPKIRVAGRDISGNAQVPGRGT